MVGRSVTEERSEDILGMGKPGHGHGPQPPLVLLGTGYTDQGDPHMQTSGLLWGTGLHSATIRYQEQWCAAKASSDGGLQAST